MYVSEETTFTQSNFIAQPILREETEVGVKAGATSKASVDGLIDRLGRTAISLVARTALSLDVMVQSELPAGPKIFAANHPSTLDPLVMISIVPEKLSILTTGGAFDVPLIGRYLRSSGHIPVVLGSGQRALNEAQQLLKAGRSIGIFPEGALSPMRGGFQQPKTGAARLALSAGVPIIPVGIGLDRSRMKFIGTYMEGEPALGHFYFSGPYAVTIGKQLHFRGQADDRSLVRNVSAQIISTISQLSEESARRLPERSRKREPQPNSDNMRWSHYA